MMLVDEGLHYVRVRGFTALPPIPGMKALVPCLRTGNKLLLAALRLPFGFVQEWKLSLYVHSTWHSEAMAGLRPLLSTVILCVLRGL